MNFGKKIRYLTKKKIEKSEVIRELLSCAIEKFSGFKIVKKKNNEKVKIGYVPIDILYLPLKMIDETIDCYFTDSIHLAFRMSMSVRKNKLLEHINAYQSHGCLVFHAVKSTFESYLKICSNMPGVIYKSENQNLASFKDNFKYLSDLPFVAYFDFETTTSSASKNSLDDEEM